MNIIFKIAAILIFVSLFTSFGYADSQLILNLDNGHQYQRFDTSMTWHQAKAFCNDTGGHLATITSQLESDFVYNNLCASSQWCWLGGTDEGSEGIWRWENGEIWSYTHWAGGEPNNCSGIEHYLMYFTPGDGRAGWWNDLGELNNGGCGCGCPWEFYTMSTVCEWDAEPECVQPPLDMVGWWPGDGNANDIQGGNNGILQNGTAFIIGKIGQAFNFDGIDDSVVVADAENLHVQNAFTIDAWVSVAEQKVTDYGSAIIERERDDTVGFSLRTDSPGTRYRCNIDNGPTDSNVFSTTQTSPGTFQHVACTFDGSALRIYVNGVLEATTLAPIIADINEPLFIGESPTASAPFKGYIDEVEIFNRALSTEELQSIYAAGSSGKCKNQSPVANAGTDQTVEMVSCAGASVILDGSGSSDPDNDSLTYTWTENGTVIATGMNPTVTLSYGSHNITLTVDDGKGGTATDEVKIDVVDTTAPALNVSLNPNVLWPPNHKYVKVTPLITVQDVCNETTTVALISKTSSEPDDGLGDGDTANDIVINTDGTISLRAERSGKGNGRIYTITYKATDAAGNSTTASATVTVPHNK